ISANAVLMGMMSVVLTAPFIDVLTISGGPRWLAAYGVAIAFAIVTAALAVAITITLFRILGPRRTLLIAQVVAAVVGTGFAIGIQIVAIVKYGELMQAGLLLSPDVIAAAPGPESVLWWPARGVLGNVPAMLAVLAFAIAALAVVVALFAPRLGEHSIAAT